MRRAERLFYSIYVEDEFRVCGLYASGAMIYEWQYLRADYLRCSFFNGSFVHEYQ